MPRTHGVSNGVCNGDGAAGATRGSPVRRPVGHQAGAVVHTATVDVQVMRLDRRQMTLAVFRQLPERDIFRDGGPTPSLLGRPWGRVLYTWNGSPEYADYYLIWSDGTRLYRMPLPLAAQLEKPAGRLGLEKGWTFFCRLNLDWVWARHEEYWTGQVPDVDDDDALAYRADDDPDEALACYAAVVTRMRAFERLPQLFIAV
jgi:hypothetical protein